MPATSKPVTCLAEGAFPKRQDLRGPDGEHDCGAAVFVVKRAVVHFILPLSVPFPSPGLREAFESVIIRELDRVALSHDVYSCLPLVAASCQNYVRIATQVDRLLLGRARAEVDGFVEPDGNERSNVRPPSARTVEIENNSAVSSIRRVSCHSVATAPGSLNRVSSVVIGSFMSCLPFPVCFAVRNTASPCATPPGQKTGYHFGPLLHLSRH